MESENSLWKPNTHVPISGFTQEFENPHWFLKVDTAIARSSLKSKVLHWNFKILMEISGSTLESQNPHLHITISKAAFPGMVFPRKPVP